MGADRSAAAGRPPGPAPPGRRAAGDPIEGRRLPLAVQVVAGLEDRPQRGVADRGDRHPGDQPADHAGLVQDDLDQFAVDRVEVGRPDRRGGGAVGGRLGRRGSARRRGAGGRRRPAGGAAAAGAGARGSSTGTRSRCESVSSALATLTSSPTRSTAGPAPGSTGPTRPPAATPRASRSRTGPRPGRSRRPAGRPPGRPGRGTASAPSARRKSHGSRSVGQGQHPDVHLVAQEQLERPVGGLLPGLVAVEDQDDAVGQPPQGQRRGRRPGPCPGCRRRWPGPTWWAAITSVYPSTTATQPASRAAGAGQVGRVEHPALLEQRRLGASSDTSRRSRPASASFCSTSGRIRPPKPSGRPREVVDREEEPVLGGIDGRPRACIRSSARSRRGSARAAGGSSCAA